MISLEVSKSHRYPQMGTRLSQEPAPPSTPPLDDVIRGLLCMNEIQKANAEVSPPEIATNVTFDEEGGTFISCANVNCHSVAPLHVRIYHVIFVHKIYYNLLVYIISYWL